MLISGDLIAPVFFQNLNPKGPEGRQGHIQIGLGLNAARQPDLAVSGQTRQGEEQSRNKLGRHIPGQGIGAGLQGSLTPDGIPGGPGQPGAHALHFLPQGRKRPLGQPPMEEKCRIHPQGSRHRQEKAQGGTAFAAVRLRPLGSRPAGHGKALRGPVHPGSKGPEAVRRGQNIPGQGGTAQVRRLPGQGSADQKPMGLGFGGNGGNGPQKGTGGNGHIHITVPLPKWRVGPPPGSPGSGSGRSFPAGSG